MLLVTRPFDQAAAWVRDLQARGVPAAAVPLIGVDEPLAPQPLLEARRQLAQWQAIFFVSPTAVDRFFDIAPVPSMGIAGSAGSAATPGPTGTADTTATTPPAKSAPPWPPHCWAAAPGPGTAQRLAAHGVPAERILQPPADSPQFDSQALWPVLAPLPWAGRAVLVVRGEGGRDWLLDRWREAGAQVVPVAAYRRGPPRLNPEQAQHLTESLRDPAAHTWLFSSSEAVANLMPLLQSRGLDTVACQTWAAQVPALATHPRILEAARHHGFAQVRACRTELAAVVDSYNRSTHDD